MKGGSKLYYAGRISVRLYYFECGGLIDNGRELYPVPICREAWGGELRERDEDI